VPMHPIGGLARSSQETVNKTSLRSDEINQREIIIINPVK